MSNPENRDNWNVHQWGSYFDVEFEIVDCADGKVEFRSADYEFMRDIEATRFDGGIRFDNSRDAIDHIRAYV